MTEYLEESFSAEALESAGRKRREGMPEDERARFRALFLKPVDAPCWYSGSRLLELLRGAK